MLNYEDIRKSLDAVDVCAPTAASNLTLILKKVLDILDPPPPDWKKIEPGSELKLNNSTIVYYYVGPYLPNSVYVSISDFNGRNSAQLKTSLIPTGKTHPTWKA